MNSPSSERPTRTAPIGPSKGTSERASASSSKAAAFAPLPGGVRGQRHAAAVVAKFDKNNPNFKNGELIFTRGLPRIGTTVLRYGREAQLLANADIDRLERIAEKFQRPDARILLKLYIAQAFFTGRIGLQGGRSLGTENFSVVTFSN